MKSSSFFNKLPKIILLIFFIVGLSYLIYWLWQRQPKNQNIEKPTTTFQKSEDTSQLEPQPSLDIEPKDGTIVENTKIKFQGNINPNYFVLIYSNSNQSVVNATPNGNFETEIDLVGGLNIYNLDILKEDLSQDKTTSVSIYSLTKDDPQDVKLLYTGSVKSIFDNLITINSSSGENTLRQKSSTKLIFSKDAQHDDKDIRIGDFLIALGTQNNEKDFDAKSIEIRRENKPTNTIQFAACKLLTAVRQNLFSANNLKDNKLLELTLDKNSKIFQDGKTADNKTIVKDKKAIVFYQNQGGKDVVKSIYILP